MQEPAVHKAHGIQKNSSSSPVALAAAAEKHKHSPEPSTANSVQLVLRTAINILHDQTWL
jgi:hypothetical protein